MTSVSHNQPAMIRTERGLIISGTRITLYDVAAQHNNALERAKDLGVDAKVIDRRSANPIFVWAETATESKTMLSDDIPIQNPYPE